MKILIAEDDAISSRLLQSRLDKWGHEVVAVKNGKEAYQRFLEDDFSMVITDWMMPKIDGLELVRRIRASENSGYVYIIMLTAKSQKEDLVAGMEVGADDFVAKPFDKEELRVRVRAGERIIDLKQRLEARNKELETANMRMKRDLDAAARIQESMLPSALPDMGDASFSWVFHPCDELAGDLLNIFKLDKKRIGLYILDVSGHGVPAALLSVTLSRILSPDSEKSDLLKQKQKGDFKESLISPVEVANKLNKRFPLDVNTGQFFTLHYGILNIETYEYRYVSAGHPGILYQTPNDPPTLLETPGLPIGFTRNGNYEEHRLHLKAGETLYLYSDGVTDIMNRRNELFGTERLSGVLQQNNQLPLDERLSILFTELKQWNGRGRFKDDITILGIDIKPHSSRKCEG